MPFKLPSQGKYQHVESRVFSATLGASAGAGAAGAGASAPGDAPLKENQRPFLKAGEKVARFVPPSPDSPVKPFVRASLGERKAPLPKFTDLASAQPAAVRAAGVQSGLRAHTHTPHTAPTRPTHPAAGRLAPQKLLGPQHDPGARAKARSRAHCPHHPARKLWQGARVPGGAQGAVGGGGERGAARARDQGGLPAGAQDDARGGARRDAGAGDDVLGGSQEGGARGRERLQRAGCPPLLPCAPSRHTRPPSLVTPPPPTHPLRCQLNAMPLRVEIPSALRRKAELEAKVAKLEDAVKVFSRPRVFVKL